MYPYFNQNIFSSKNDNFVFFKQDIRDTKIILEQKPVINGNMLELLDKVLNFNNDYLTFLKSELDSSKKQLKETENNG